MTRAFPNHMRRASPPMSSSWDEPEGLARDREGAMRSIGATAPATKFCLEPWEGIKRAVGGEWLVSKRVPMRGIGILFGESQSFKTFVAMDLGLHVALGEDWAGRRSIGAPVVYIAAEGEAGVKKRKEGLERTRADLPERLPFYLVAAAPNLGTGAEDRIALIASIEAAGVTPGLVILDTLAKCLGGGDENGSGMIALLGNADAIARHFGCFVLIIHHVGLGESDRERGHSSALGGTDMRILCKRKDREMSTTLTWRKLKDEDNEITLRANLSRVVIGEDEDGDVSTLVVDAIEEAEGGAPAQRSKSFPASQRLLMTVLAEAVSEGGEAFQPTGDRGPMVRAVADSVVRDAYYGRIAEQAEPDEDPGKLAARRRRAFNRAVAETIKAQRIAAGEDHGRRLLWLP